jgi:hypothetical protein
MLILQSSLLIIFALLFGPTWAYRTNTPWFVTQDQSNVVKLGILAMVIGLVLAQLVTANAKQLYDQNLYTLVNNGRVLCYLAICAYLVWFTASSNEWLHPHAYGHISTIPGISTITQILPLGLSCLLLGRKFGLSLPQDRWIFIGTFLLTCYRAFGNNERLALAETYFPIIIIFLTLSPRRRGLRKFGRFMILPGIAFGGGIFFAALEYFRSWNHYRFFHSGSYISFAAQRLESYYITALNNGAIYNSYLESSNNFFITFLDFVWKFPIIGQRFLNEFSPNFSFDWATLLKSAIGTDEFNNPSTILPLASETTRIGMMLILVVMAFWMSRLHSRMHNGDFVAILTYASLAIGLFELPLFFWFTLGKTLPVYISLFWLIRNQKKMRRIKTGPLSSDGATKNTVSTKYAS